MFMIHHQMTLRPLLLYGVTQHRLTTGYQHFRSAYQSHLQGQAVQTTCQMTKHLNYMVTEAWNLELYYILVIRQGAIYHTVWCSCRFINATVHRREPTCI